MTPAGSWSVATDRTRCIGSGMCTVYAPGSFSQDEQAKVVVLEQGRDGVDAVRTAVEACPTRALMLIVDRGE